MEENPYEYTGPLDPVKHELTCVPRAVDVNRVIAGIKKGDYWAVLGPRQIGKTTFLRQIKQQSENEYHVYIDFEVIPSIKERDFYCWLRDEIFNRVPSKQDFQKKHDFENENPGFGFLCFLEWFRAEDKKKKIILLFDEIDRLPFLREFLHIWRKVFHERYENEELRQYAPVITGSVDLIEKTTGPTSPFNIAKLLYLKDFSHGHSENLINRSFKKLNINIEHKAKNKLVSRISGHPQMLQHACYILVDRAGKPNVTITGKEVKEAIDELMVLNSNLDTLKQNIINNKILESLLRDILNGKRRKFYPYKEFAISGVGAITNKKSNCAIRNKVYRKCIIDFMKKRYSQSPVQKKKNKDNQDRIVNTLSIILSLFSTVIGLISLLADYSPGVITAISLLTLVLIFFLVYVIGKRHS
ncbi:MAG: AAA-like domain-containing protein [Candidatus Aminicenantes bacterium]|nr:AAA-like domain-containing protein [Candidatus Aminicenantes bacterium]